MAYLIKYYRMAIELDKRGFKNMTYTAWHRTYAIQNNFTAKMVMKQY